MDDLTQVILFFAHQLGLSPVAVAALIPTIILVSRTVTRLIPDTATGPLMYLRLATKFIGLHVKDNTGVPAIIGAAGSVIRQADPNKIPEAVEQGILDLAEGDTSIDVFRRGAAALGNRDAG